MKKCKFCITEIDDKAKICPNCKKDLRDFFSRHPIITFILFLFILGTVINWMSEFMYNGKVEKINNNSFDPTSPYTDGTCSTNEKNTVIKYLGVIDGEITDCVSSPNSIIGTIIGHNVYNAKIAKNFICDKNKCIYKE